MITGERHDAHDSILITTEVSPIIIAHLHHMVSGAETRKLQKVAIAKKKCIQVGPPYLDV